MYRLEPKGAGGLEEEDVFGVGASECQGVFFAMEGGRGKDVQEARELKVVEFADRGAEHGGLG